EPESQSPPEFGDLGGEQDLCVHRSLVKRGAIREGESFSPNSSFTIHNLDDNDNIFFRLWAGYLLALRAFSRN
ncbi:MAG TPA: hypothetical protein V6D50_15315, partial [Chroococcales cyanobacterium]